VPIHRPRHSYRIDSTKFASLYIETDVAGRPNLDTTSSREKPNETLPTGTGFASTTSTADDDSGVTSTMSGSARGTATRFVGATTAGTATTADFAGDAACEADGVAGTTGATCTAEAGAGCPAATGSGCATRTGDTGETGAAGWTAGSLLRGVNGDGFCAPVAIPATTTTRIANDEK
jgi:hypothetical protein